MSNPLGQIVRGGGGPYVHEIWGKNPPKKNETVISETDAKAR